MPLSLRCTLALPGHGLCSSLAAAAAPVQVRPRRILRVTPLLTPGVAEDIAVTLAGVEVTRYGNGNLCLNWGLAQAAEPDSVPNTVSQCLSMFDLGCAICLQLWMQLPVRMGDETAFGLTFQGYGFSCIF